jgi:hypothetical protein
MIGTVLAKAVETRQRISLFLSHLCRASAGTLVIRDRHGIECGKEQSVGCVLQFFDVLFELGEITDPVT